MAQNVSKLITTICVVTLFTGCVTSVDEALPYDSLPEITVATEVTLVASPSHPTAYLSSAPVRAGEKVQVIGSDEDAAWLFVLHSDRLGWMPSIFSRNNVGTLRVAIGFEQPTNNCTKYLGAVTAPDEVWESKIASAVNIVGTIYRPQVAAQFDGATLALEIHGTGTIAASDYVHTLLTPSSAVVLFAFSVDGLQKGSQISFGIKDTGKEPLFFQAAFFSKDCSDDADTSQLPIGKIKLVTAERGSDHENNASQATSPSSAPIVVSSSTHETDSYSAEEKRARLRLLNSHHGWRREWSIIVPGDFNGDRFTDLLFYDPTRGHGEFYTTDGNGKLSLLNSYTDWRRDWSIIVPGDFGGNKFTDLLFYDPTRGHGEFYTTDGHGKLSLLHSYTDWRREWSLIVPGNFDGDRFTDLLFYDPTRGHGEFYSTDGNGKLLLLNSHADWRREWSIIVPGDFNDDRFTDLLFYDPLHSEGEFYTTDGHGKLSLLKSYTGWQRERAVIVPGDFDGDRFTDLLFYDSTHGKGEFYTTDGHGFLRLLNSYTDWRRNWLLIVPGAFGSELYSDLVFYDSTSGEAEFYTTE